MSAATVYREDFYTIREMAKLGYSRAEVAEEIGCSIHALKRACRKWEIRFPRPGPRPVTKLRQYAFDMIGNGEMSCMQIGKAIGRSGTLVQNWVKQAVANGTATTRGCTKGRKIYLKKFRGKKE